MVGEVIEIRSAAPAVGQLVDDVVAVAEGERVGVVTIAAIERLHHRRRDREVVDEEVFAGADGAASKVPLATKRIDVCAPICAAVNAMEKLSV